LRGRAGVERNLIVDFRRESHCEAYARRDGCVLPTGAASSETVVVDRRVKTLGAIPGSQLAAMTMVANQLMNLDEVLNK
jgi:hypothetical protein